MGHIFQLAVIMIASGVIGGIASYYASDVRPEESSPILKRIGLGVAAAFVVPLFLSMISSSILTNPEQTPTNYLVFAGFCIVAAFSSKAFLTTVSKSILDRVQSVEQKQQDLQSDVEPIIAKETEPEPEELASPFAVELDADENVVLQALANPKYTRRYLKGVAAEANLTEAQVASVLSDLRKKYLAGSKPGRRHELFWITAEGRGYLRASHGD